MTNEPIRFTDPLGLLKLYGRISYNVIRAMPASQGCDDGNAQHLPGEALPDPTVDLIIPSLLAPGLISGIRALGGAFVPKQNVLQYHPRLEGQIDLYHNFPRIFDQTIIKSGKPTVINGGYTQYELPGAINGVAGSFQVGIQNGITIIHRFFQSF